MRNNRPRALPLFFAALIAGVAIAGTPSSSAAQQPLFRVTGTITDTTGKPAEGATVTLYLAATGGRVDSAVARSTESGAYNVGLPFPSRWNGGKFAVVVRKLGYSALTHMSDLAPVVAEEGVTARVSFRLLPAAHALGSVTVRGNRGSELARKVITSAEFNPKHSYDALGVLIRNRPLMLGDTDRCPIPPFASGTSAYAIERIYVNGRRMDMYGRTPFRNDSFRMPKRASISPAVLAVLEEIPAEDIEQIQLVDCLDNTFPIDRRKALYVALKAKPLTKKQKKALDELRRKDTLQRDTAGVLRDTTSQ